MKHTCFHAWMQDVITFARDELSWGEKALASIDQTAEGWEEYYNEGLTPREAWREEYDAAR